jgi:hypothetical protein
MVKLGRNLMALVKRPIFSLSTWYRQQEINWLQAVAEGNQGQSYGLS